MTHRLYQDVVGRELRGLRVSGGTTPAVSMPCCPITGVPAPINELAPLTVKQWGKGTALIHVQRQALMLARIFEKHGVRLGRKDYELELHQELVVQVLAAERFEDPVPSCPACDRRLLHAIRGHYVDKDGAHLYIAVHQSCINKLAAMRGLKRHA